MGSKWLSCVILRRSAPWFARLALLVACSSPLRLGNAELAAGDPWDAPSVSPAPAAAAIHFRAPVSMPGEPAVLCAHAAGLPGQRRYFFVTMVTLESTIVLASSVNLALGGDEDEALKMVELHVPRLEAGMYKMHLAIEGAAVGTSEDAVLITLVRTLNVSMSARPDARDHGSARSCCCHPDGLPVTHGKRCLRSLLVTELALAAHSHILNCASSRAMNQT